MLTRLDVPVFHLVFQLMIFAALLESGTGAVHAVNQRIAGVLSARGIALPTIARLVLAASLLVVSIFFATRFGLVALIAQGYRTLAYLFIAVYAVPILTYGVWWLAKNRAAPAPEAPPAAAAADP
jgi:uncharacterized membrane protein YkvI